MQPERHFTATVHIIDRERVLLIYHRKFNKWLPPGGHIDANETPPEAAKREVREETGLEIEFIRQENYWIDRWNTVSIERPYLCLLHNVPFHQGVPAHQHIDMIFIAQPSGGKECLNSHETNGIRWFTLKEIDQLKSDEEIFSDTQELIRHIFYHFA